MRVLVLVLALFVGCNANSFHADRPTPKLDELTRTVAEIVGAIWRAVDRSVEHIMRNTEPGIYWSARLKEFFKQGEQYLDAAWEQIPQETKDVIAGFYLETFSTIRRMEIEVENFKREIETMLEPAGPVAEGIAAELTDEVKLVKNFASTYFAWLELHVQEYVATLKSSTTPQQ